MGFIFDAIGSVVKAVVGVVAKIAGGVFGFLVGGKPKSAPAKSSVGRLNKTLNPEDFRKIVFGKTASALDLRYWEVYGTNGTQYDEVIAMACHQINSVKEFYVEDALAIDAGNTTQTNYSGVLTRAFKLGAPAQTALSVGGGGQWTAAATMTGVAHMVLKWTKNDTKLPNGPPSRYTNIIEGALVYDPRRDSTQPGGSGTHRINDQTTWDYSTLDSNNVPIGRNNALQALWYLLGWRVANPSTGEMVLVAGRGVDPNDINIQSFITGANNCEAAGYYTDMILSTEDEHTSNEDKITADGLIAQLIDPGGLWSYYANVDDTATVAVYLTDNDILDTGKVSWNEYKPMSEQFNQVVGKFIDPSATALFQPRAYPMVRDTTYETNLGVKRRKSIDFEQIQDALLAQKLARLSLNMGQYQAEFSANFSYRAIKAQAWSIVSYTSERFGWTKLFRVYRQAIGPQGIGMTLREVNASIWTPGSVVTPPTVPLGVKYDTTQQISLSGLTASAYSGTGADGTIRDGMTLSWSTPPANVLRTEVQIKLSSDSYWQSFGPFKADVTGINVFPLLSNSVYNVRARHVSTNEIAGPWINLVGNFTVGNTSNVNIGAINAAAQTAIWSSVTGAGRPADNATVGAQLGSNLKNSAGTAILGDSDVITIEGVAGALAGSGAGAYANNLAELNTADNANLNNALAVGGYPSKNANANFVKWTDPSAAPDGWSNSYGSPSWATRTAAANGYVYDVTVPASSNHEINQGVVNGAIAKGYHTIECEVEFVSGNWRGSGVRFYWYPADWSTTLGMALIYFDYTPDINGNVLGETPAARKYYFKKTFYIPDVAAHQGYFGVSAGGIFAGMAAVASHVKFHLCAVRPANDGEIVGLTLRPKESGADVTANAQVSVEGPTAKTINSDYTGTIASGVLPAAMAQPKVVKGGTTITTANNVSYAIQNALGGCSGNVTVDNTNGSATKGVVTIGAGFNASGSYELVVTVDGYAYPAIKVTVTKQNGDPPSGGGGSTSGSFDPNAATVASTSYTEVGRVSDLTVASGKTVNAYLSGNYVVDATANATRSMSAKWQYSVAGANSWTDFTTPVSGSNAQLVFSTYDQTAGSITCNQSKSGLSAGNYDIRLVAAISSIANSAYLSFDGLASASATVT